MKQQKVNQTYNDGIVSIFEVSIAKDKFNTPIKHKKTETLVKRFWYRVLGITAEEQYYAYQVNEDIALRIAFPLCKNANVKHIVHLKDKKYAITRVFQNTKKNETELSLKEVS